MNILQNLFSRKTKVQDFSYFYMSSGGFEHCIMCHKKLDILKSTPIDQRLYYIEGAGQLCKDCWEGI